MVLKIFPSHKKYFVFGEESHIMSQSGLIKDEYETPFIIAVDK